MDFPLWSQNYSLAYLLSRAAAQRPDYPSLIDTATQKQWSVRESYELVARMAAFLRDHGVQRGDRVVMCGRNTPAHVIVSVAAMWCGAIACPLPASAAPRELVWLLQDSAPTLAFCDAHITKRLRHYMIGKKKEEENKKFGNEKSKKNKIKKEKSNKENDEKETDFSFPIFSLDHAIDIIDNIAPIDTPPEVLVDDISAIIYTSGSTGKPKGACLSARSLWWGGQNFRTGFGLNTSVERELVSTPLSHIGGFNGTTLDIFCNGGTVVISPRFEAGMILRMIEHYRISVMFAVPTMMRMLISHPDFAHTDVSSWKKVLVGGDPLDAQLAQHLFQVGLAPIHVWGLTEAAGSGACLLPSSHILPRPHHREGHSTISVGTPFPHVCIAVADDAGHRLPAGDIGHILMNGPHMFSGYWHGCSHPLDHESVMRTVEGVPMYDTGDMGMIDQDGHLWIVGRATRMIHTGGEMVTPGEVEAALRTLPGVEDVAVTGIPDEQWGQRVVAVIASAQAKPLWDVSGIRQRLENDIARWKLPTRLTYVAELPRNAHGKIDYRAIGRMWDA